MTTNSKDKSLRMIAKSVKTLIWFIILSVVGYVAYYFYSQHQKAIFIQTMMERSGIFD